MSDYLPFLFLLNTAVLLVYLTISAKYCVKNYDNKIKGKKKEKITNAQYISGIIYVITSIVALASLYIYEEAVMHVAIVIFSISLILTVTSIVMRLCKNKEISSKLLITSTLIIVVPTTIYGAALRVENVVDSRKIDTYITPIESSYMVNKDKVKGTEVKKMLGEVIETNKFQREKNSKHMIIVDGLDGKIKIEGTEYTKGSDLLIKNNKSYSWKFDTGKSVKSEIWGGYMTYYESINITIEEVK